MCCAPDLFLDYPVSAWRLIQCISTLYCWVDRTEENVMCFCGVNWVRLQSYAYPKNLFSW